MMHGLMCKSLSVHVLLVCSFNSLFSYLVCFYYICCTLQFVSSRYIWIVDKVSTFYRDLSELGMGSMGMKQGPPGMSRDDFDARKADLRRKREMERFSQR